MNMSTTDEDDRYATLAEEIRELAVYAPDEVVPGFYTIARLVEDLVEDRAKLLAERDECRKP